MARRVNFARAMRRALLLLLASCTQLPDLDDTADTEAPLVGVDGSHDGADRNCNVVLRSLERNTPDGFTFETHGSSWVWSGVVEVSEAAAAEGLQPALLYHTASGAWHTATATPVADGATPGYARYAIRIADDLPGPATPAADVEVVPYLRLAAGGRLFDHNRNPGDLANYVMTSPDYAIWRNDATCAAPTAAQHADLVFAADYTQHREGVIVAGGSLTIKYDAARLATCRQTQGGHPVYDITANVRFDPTGQLLAASVRDGAATFTVPTDGAQRVAVWFETTSISGCHAYDSNFGANYTFDVARAPQWIGNVQTLLARDPADPCDGGRDARTGFTFDTWTRQRATATNLCFEVYQPNLTDHDDPDLWQKLDAAIRYRIVGETQWHTIPAQLAGRRGNNARYATSWRPVDPFRPYQCPSVTPTPTPDGMYRQLAVEYVPVVNGAEVRPEPGAAFSGTFVDYPSTTCP